MAKVTLTSNVVTTGGKRGSNGPRGDVQKTLFDYAEAMADACRESGAQVVHAFVDMAPFADMSIKMPHNAPSQTVLQSLESYAVFEHKVQSARTSIAKTYPAFNWSCAHFNHLLINGEQVSIEIELGDGHVIEKAIGFVCTPKA